MLVSTTGTLKPARVTFHSRSGQKSQTVSIPVIFPFAAMILYYLNVRVLLSPSAPSRMLVVKVTLKQLVTCLIDFNINSFLRLAVIHVIFTPKHFKREQIIKLNADSLLADVWVSRFIQKSGIAANSFSNTHEDDFRISFNKKQLHLLWLTYKNGPMEYNQRIQLRTRIGLTRISEQNLLSKGEIKFVNFEDSEIIHGSYALKDDSFIRNIPYNISEFNTFPQSNLIVDKNILYRQDVFFRLKADEALFIGSSGNWYHFLIEILPRGLHWLGQSKKNVPIVFRKPVPTSIMRILKAIPGINPILVADGESVLVNSLTIALDARFDTQPDMLTISSGKNIFADRLVDMKLIANWLELTFPPSNEKFPAKIFLARGKNSLRPMSNFEQVQNYLELQGYRTVFPEKLSLEDQIGMFSNVEMLIAEGGAALTGLIFAKRLKSLVHIEANPNYFVSNFWQQFSEVLNINSRACLGVPEYLLGVPSGRFKVNLEDLKKQLN